MGPFFSHSLENSSPSDLNLIGFILISTIISILIYLVFKEMKGSKVR